jgi:hypothetical protein
MVTLAMAAPLAGAGAGAPAIIGALTVPITCAFTVLFIKWEGKRLSDYGFAVVSGSWLRFVGGLSLGFALVVTHTAVIWLGGSVSWAATSPTRAMLLPICGYLLLATREELAFRGYPLRELVTRLGPWNAQIIVAALFVIEHRLGGSSWENALLGSGMGALVFGMAALAAKGLALPIGLHAAWNIGDWARGGKGAGGLWHPVIDSKSALSVETWTMTSYLAVMSLAFAGLWMWYRRVQRSTV